MITVNLYPLLTALPRYYRDALAMFATANSELRSIRGFAIRITDLQKRVG
jgi:hypothetical protein